MKSICLSVTAHLYNTRSGAIGLEDGQNEKTSNFNKCQYPSVLEHPARLLALNVETEDESTEDHKPSPLTEV